MAVEIDEVLEPMLPCWICGYGPHDEPGDTHRYTTEDEVEHWYAEQRREREPLVERSALVYFVVMETRWVRKIIRSLVNADNSSKRKVFWGKI